MGDADSHMDDGMRLFETSGGDSFDRPIRAQKSARPTVDEIMERVLSSTDQSQIDTIALAKNIYDLRDPNEKISRRAQTRLVSLSAAVVPALVRCFELTVPPGLGDLGVSFIDDEYGEVIEQIGTPAIDELVLATEIPNRNIVRLRAINMLGRIKDGDATKIMPSILSVIEDSASERGDTHVYSTYGLLIEEARNVLRTLTSTDQSSHPRILAFLSHHDGLVREVGYQVISHHLDAQTAVPALLNCFREEENRKKEEYDLHISNVQGEIIYALARYGMEDARVTPFLIDLALNKPEVGSAVRDALRPQHCDADEVIPAMIEVIKKQDDESHDARFNALFILGRYGAAASDAVPLIMERIQQNQQAEEDVSREVRALGEIAQNLEEGELRDQAVEVLRLYRYEFYYGGWDEVMRKLGLDPYK